MKVKNFTGEVRLRYELKDSELEAATADVLAMYQNSQKSDWPTEEIAKTSRSVRIYRNDKTGILKVGDRHHSVEIKTYTHILQA